MDSILLRSPATIANLSCGFDVLGVCLNKPYDEIQIIKNSSKKVIIRSLDSPFSDIPTNPRENTGGIPAELIINDLDLDFGFNINIKKGIPLCGGLGSSAATAAGVVYGINKLLNNKLSKMDLIKYALEGERISSESPHVDNIGPCIMGGFTIIKSIDPIDIIKIKTDNMYFAVIHPDVMIDTKTARKILPEKILLNDAIKQWGNIAALIYGFTVFDKKIISSSMKDFIIEPIRSQFIPGYKTLKEKSLDSGAIGCSISGSGPSVFSLCDSKDIAKSVLTKMENVLIDKSISFHSYISSINQSGIKIV